MARTKSVNGDRLEDALSNLLQTQAAFLARVSETDRQLVEIKKEMVETERQLLEVRKDMIETQRINNERFARIEATLLDHSRILADHTRILQSLAEAIQELPDAIRGKFGFRPPE
jgi:TolA-binding protein